MLVSVCSGPDNSAQSIRTSRSSRSSMKNGEATVVCSAERMRTAPSCTRLNTCAQHAPSIITIAANEHTAHMEIDTDADTDNRRGVSGVDACTHGLMAAPWLVIAAKMRAHVSISVDDDDVSTIASACDTAPVTTTCLSREGEGERERERHASHTAFVGYRC